MADILGRPTKPMPHVANKEGGIKEFKPVPNYSPPVGPSNIGDPKTPGIHGTNHGNSGTQGKR